MKLVIEISNELYEMILNLPNFISGIATQAVRDGIPLPEGHGDLIDRDELLKEPIDIANYPSNYVKIAKAIIKADTKMIGNENCKECNHTEDECKDCYPELGHKNDKLKRDTEAVEKFVKSDFFKELIESFDK